MPRILAISAGLSQPSSTRMLTDRLLTATRQTLGHEEDEDSEKNTATHRSLELREYAHDITDHLLTGFANDRLRPVLDDVATAEGLILVSPTFTASYSGLLKSFLDVIDPEAMAGKPVLLGATGGTERHSLMLEYALRPVLSYLRAHPVATAVYAAGADWGNDTALDQRISRAADELATRMHQSPQQRATDPFTHPVPFEQLLHDARTA